MTRGTSSKTSRIKGEQRAQLSVVGNNIADAAAVKALDAKREKLTLDLDLAAVDEVLAKLDRNASLRSVNWEIVEQETDPEAPAVTSSVTFARKVGGIEVRKTFTLNRLSKEELAQPEAIDLAIGSVRTGSNHRTAESHERRSDTAVCAPGASRPGTRERTECS